MNLIMMKKLFSSLVLTFGILTYSDFAYAERIVIQLESKKYIPSKHYEGIDTYDKYFNYTIEEKYILQFNNNRYFLVPKYIFNNANIGEFFTTENNELFYCREEDECQ